MACHLAVMPAEKSKPLTPLICRSRQRVFRPTTQLIAFLWAIRNGEHMRAGSLPGLDGAFSSSPLPIAPHKAAVVGDHRMGAVLAACHMPAEGGRAAALDGAHHLELVEAHAAAVGIAPCSPVAAEDVRDLQTWPGHAGGLRRPSGYPL